ncbi:MAG: DUF1772 domain-containing protein [Thermoanaerobaculia bacterium]|nr:DUF1772 domain-containing protein [Thermoanaerobaculia bacterium]
MQDLQLLLTVLAALGSAVMAGVFFVFSVMVMPALGRLEPIDGVAAMQRINEVALRPPFLASFFLSTALCLGGVVLSIVRWSSPGSAWLLGGGLMFLFGVFLVTAAGNVPLNEELARWTGTAADAADLWDRYLSSWTRWNHLRAAAGLASAAMLLAAFPQ